jgi:hypothetical protein
MINLNDDKQAEALLLHALDNNHSAGSLMGVGTLFIATLACRINKEGGGSIDYIVDWVCKQIKGAASRIISESKILGDEK